jgi:hypothetical protein
MVVVEDVLIFIDATSNCVRDCAGESITPIARSAPISSSNADLKNCHRKGYLTSL